MLTVDKTVQRTAQLKDIESPKDLRGLSLNDLSIIAEEIRQKIKQTPDVEDAVVIARPTDKGRENTISALVQGDINIIQVRKAMSALLEPYAIPRQIKITAAIPMLPTGKYDRKAIEALFR